ncbi:MAG: phage major capsid protein [Bacteroidales bacterium]|nr:phage major capsid protein [Bacteroidales bacterium]
MRKKELQAAAREAQMRMVEAQKANDTEAFNAAEREMRGHLAEIALLNSEEQSRQVAAGQKVDKEKQLREILMQCKNGGKKDFVLQQREVTSSIINTGDTNNMESAGFPVTIEDLLLPLEVDFVYDKVGLQIQTGVSGQLQWPCLDTTAEVTIVGETVALGDSDLDFSKIVPTQKRMGISIKVSWEALENASFNLYNTVTSEMRQALKRALNKAVTSTTGFGQLVGPFAGTSEKLNKITFAGAMPTYVELLQMKGKVAGTGAKIGGFCYLMNTFTYATLEATSKTESNGGMIIENGTLGGYPVFVTDDAKIADGCVNAGSFVYAALLQHGDLHFVIDPYTLASNNEIKFTLNCNWSLTTLKYEGFCVGTAASN